ncbi:tetratricopeptide repeat protein [Rhodohalobacter sp.]|uniref:tetratricopeptide repeat protein n=1 Tax=Rhodohalobacter sp. TaxID=1974210 RepID=UPI002ACE9D2C|nr:tetratricopeptide repeat protein [Rhodohalobacter sp.]MDZ7757109.1 tetratricopeptide repeat protein [Rhodohalobacter sp.]
MLVRFTVNSKLFVIALLISLVPIFAAAQSQTVSQGIQKYQQGNFQEAIDLLEIAKFNNSMNAQGYIVLASSYLEIQIPEKAENNALEGKSIFPDILAFDWIIAEALLNQRKIQKARNKYLDVQDALHQGRSLSPLNISNEILRVRLGQVYQVMASDAYQNDQFDLAINRMTNAVEFMTDSVQVHKNLAILLIEQEQYDRALEVLDTAKNIFPDDTEILRIKASIYFKTEERDKLIDQFEELYRTDPADIDNGLIYAELLMSSNKTSDGIDVIEDLMERHPEEKRIYRMMAEINERQFNISGKRAVLREMQKQFPDDYSILEDIAETYKRESKWEEARAVYDSLKVKTNDVVKYELEKASTWERQDSLAVAEVLYRNLLEEYNGNDKIVLSLGNNLEKQSKWGQAYLIYHDALDSVKENDVVLDTRLAISSVKSDQDSAKVYVDQALNLGSENPALFLEASKLYLGINNQEKAFDLAERSLRKSFSDLAKEQTVFEQNLDKEGILGQAGNVTQIEKLEFLNSISEEAFEWLAYSFKGKDVKPVLDEMIDTYKTSGKLFFLVGKYYYSRSEKEIAETHLKKSVEYSPELFEAHLELSEIHEDKGNIEEAIASLERALSLNSTESTVYSKLIQLYREIGQLDQLSDRWSAKYRADKNNELLREHLIEALHKAGRYDEAREIIDQ